MTVTRLCRCGKPLRNSATVCTPCTRSLERALGDIPWITVELRTSMARQHAAPLTGTTSHGNAEQPLPWDDRAARTLRQLRDVLARWVHVCQTEHIGQSRIADPAKDPASMARWMMHRVNDLQRHDRGPDAVDDIVDVAARAQRVVFWKPRARIYLGPCAYGSGLVDQLSTCPGDVYADDGEPVGKCDTCDRGVTVVVRQEELDRDLHGRLLTAAEIADWAMRMGLNAKRDEVRRRVLYWHRHKRITAQGHDDRGGQRVPLFRYGDVRLLLDLEYGGRAS